MEEPNQTVRYGNPWWTLLYVGFMLAALIFQAVLATSALVIGAKYSRPAPFITGLFFAPLLILEVVVLTIVLVRHPTRIWRMVTVTPAELQLPDPKWRHVQIGDVTGVALARLTKARGSNRGSWAPIFWRSDGQHAWVGGLGFVTSKADPAGTKQAAMVTEIHSRVATLQGPEGRLLAGHHPGLSTFGSLDRVWNPPDEQLAGTAP
jgi:hypothetical protein